MATKKGRDRSIEITCTEIEKALLRQRAKESGLTLSRYLCEAGTHYNRVDSISQAQLYWQMQLLAETIKLYEAADASSVQQAIDLIHQVKRELAMGRVEAKAKEIFDHESAISEWI